MRYTLCLAALLTAFAAIAETAIGDWGHFISYTPTTYFNNPDGKAFTIKVHVMQWGIKKWTRKKTKLRLVGPGEKILADGEHQWEESKITLNVPRGTPGVYRLHTTDNVWIWCSLKQSVAWTGVPRRHLMDVDRRIDTGRKNKRGKPITRRPAFYEKEGQLVLQASVPRRWWFWVPKKTRKFSCTAMRADRCMSQREDWGYFIITPRGQRIRALWGQPPQAPQGKNYRQDMKVDVEVEPGAAGRFWCLEVSLGDSHQYSNINFSLDGVPPYLARSPEEWFNPKLGKAPSVELYDEYPFFQSAKTDVLKTEWPGLQHWSPCPSIGDPDGIEVLGDATYALWNPEGKELKFRVGTYLPREGKDAAPADVRITGPDGKTLVDEKVAMHHLHNKDGHPTHTLKPAKGVTTVSIAGVERWMSYTYPAVPMVLLGKKEGDWSRFRFTACAPRNWYFFVPQGTKTFKVRVAADQETDVVKLEICAPDRVPAMVYGRSGQQTVTVPAGLDGKIWHLRPSVGSATRMITEKGPNYRYQDLPLTIDLQGVPGCLSPTWEQWFDPKAPKRPANR